MTGALTACGGGTSAPAGSAAASAAAPATSAGPPSGSLGTLRVASTSTAGTQTPLWLADALGLWTKRGLKVERSQVTPDVGTKTLLAREIDVLMQSPPPIITADLNGNIDLVYVGSVYNHSQFGMAVEQGIKSAADLAGKAVGTDLPGSVNNYQTEVMLGKLGLKDSDVKLVRLQGSEAMYAGLLAGQIQGAPISVPQVFQAEGKGYKVLVNTFDIKYQNIGPVVLKSRLKELSPQLTAFLLGLRDGMQAFVAQPEMAKKLIGTNTKETDPMVLQQTYDFYAKTTQFNTSLQPTLEGIQSMIDFLASSTLPRAKNAKAEQFVDNTILSTLPAS